MTFGLTGFTVRRESRYERALGDDGKAEPECSSLKITVVTEKD